jgi:Kef-type K+ transport system membrane component KefB
MASFLQLILLLSIILLVAKFAGYLSTLARQPSVLGEILVGLLVGPSLLDVTHAAVFQDQHLGEVIYELAEVGVILLMFVAGLELHLGELIHNSKLSVMAGTLGVVLPVSLGWVVGRFFALPGNQALFLGLALGATSVSISAQTLMELKVLRSRVGLGLLGAAVFDDVLVVLLLSIVLASVQGGVGLFAVLLVFGRMVVFLGLSIMFGWWVLPLFVRKVARLPISQGVLALGLIVMFLYAVAAEVVGSMAGITGAFLAGLMFARTSEKERLERGMHALAYGLFVPIFFVNIGLSVNLRELGMGVIGLLLVISLVAVLGKLAGAGLGARLAGLPTREAVQLGAGMVSRGEVGLIIASVGRSQGLLGGNEFSAIIGMVLVSTLITPPLLRGLFKSNTTMPVAQANIPSGKELS